MDQSNMLCACVCLCVCVYHYNSCQSRNLCSESSRAGGNAVRRVWSNSVRKWGVELSSWRCRGGMSRDERKGSQMRRQGQGMSAYGFLKTI